MTPDQALWYAARIAALAAFFALTLSMVTGMAIRTAYLSPLARSRAVISAHSFLTWIWLPLILVHIVTIVLDSTAGLRWLDVVLPFQVHLRNQGTVGSDLAIGLGTVGFLLLLLVGISAGFRRRMGRRTWNWIHRVSYPMFVLFLLHAQFAGTDFTHTAISLAGWATLGALALLTLPRIAGGRMSAETRERSDSPPTAEEGLATS